MATRAGGPPCPGRHSSHNPTQASAHKHPTQASVGNKQTEVLHSLLTLQVAAANHGKQASGSCKQAHTSPKLTYSAGSQGFGTMVSCSPAFFFRPRFPFLQPSRADWKLRGAPRGSPTCTSRGLGQSRAGICNSVNLSWCYHSQKMLHAMQPYPRV